MSKGNPPIVNYYEAGAATSGPPPFPSAANRRTWKGAMTRSGKPPAAFLDLLAFTQGEQWMRDAACANTGDPDAWFPGTGSSRVATRICRKCPVQTQCLDMSLRRREHGIWGGVSENARKPMRKDASDSNNNR